MYFGGSNGVSYFRLFERAKHPLLNLLFTDLYIYNEPVKVDKGEILSKAINYIDKINIKSDVKIFPSVSRHSNTMHLVTLSTKSSWKDSTMNGKHCHSTTSSPLIPILITANIYSK